MPEVTYDVAIIGGGPAGSTAASILRKYSPELGVLVLERSRFPRDHVGESQLPSISPILAEMGVWDQVESAGFPIKIGASYTWGKDLERWDFDFFPVENWQDEPRPAKFVGQRTSTAFQVDRARYDEILLNHAASLGAIVRQDTGVRKVLTDKDKITGLVLDNGEQVTARHYIDASGVVGLFRRAFKIGANVAKELRNIAVWDYWENAEWAVEIGVGGTRVQVRSLPWGWLWFIPLGPTRTSIGLVCPNDHHKLTGKTPAELYHEAVASQPEIAKLIKNATPENQIRTCKDWSTLVDRLVGENWFMVGEAAGFADPILAAGMSLAHSSAREAAYTILELERDKADVEWLRTRYDDRNRRNIQQHIRFAQYWYAANGCFTDLQEHCQAIADEAGLRLNPEQAWQWLSQGGFTTEQVGLATVGSFDVASIKQLVSRFDKKGRDSKMKIDGKNVFRLNLDGAVPGEIGELREGRIKRISCWKKGAFTLPLTGYYGALFQVLGQTNDGTTILEAFRRKIATTVHPAKQSQTLNTTLQTLEVMVQEGWVTASWDKTRPRFKVRSMRSRYIRDGKQGDAALAARKSR
ncbi:MAG: NAD(P)/FAD-dependent oxidoreductase [Paracoccaceae bacterium]